MNETSAQSSLIKTPCPICGGKIEIVMVDIVNPWDLKIEKINEDLIYKGISYVFIGSVEALCSLYGIPFGNKIGRLAKDALEKASLTIIDIIEGKPQLMYFFEIRCSDCNIVLKRYYTPNI